MEQDQKKIQEVIGKVLIDHGAYHLYPMSELYLELERYIEQQRIEALVWMLAECCVLLDKGDDPRKMEIPDMLERAKFDLGNQPEAIDA